MTRRKQYPDECPVFRCVENGRDYVARPGIDIWDESLNFLIGDSEEDGDIVHIVEQDKPFAVAARELLAWARQ